jgi:hypothetical protein
VSPKADREASPIFFGENTFQLDACYDISKFLFKIYPRHAKLLHKLVLHWDLDRSYVWYSEEFPKLARFESLSLLTVEVDERKWLSHELKHRADEMRWHESLGFSNQVQHKAYFMPGMTAFRSLSSVRVELPLSIEGGPLSSAVKAELRKPLRGGFRYVGHSSLTQDTY